MNQTKPYKIVINQGEPIECVPGQTIVQAAPHIALKGCKEGGCGRCKVIIVKGQINRGDFNTGILSEDHKAQGYILSCQTVPLSDLEIHSQN
ncbi:MAG: 2Fe-2S iron-sulfur cluster-binding protein [SAR324 cluster bacterium]|nr:2Fe-2S iron-sulfur cluster-binding protein [SAR324 cluster bacterium]